MKLFSYCPRNFLLITPIFLLLSHYLAMLPHEYAHSLMAWILGFKSNPLDLTYGGTGLSNLLLLSNMDENVNYRAILSSGHPYAVSLIAFAGPGIANGLMFMISWVWLRNLIKNPNAKKHPYLFYFLFLFNLMNLGNFYDYVPMRVFASYGDVHNFIVGLGISPWWIYILGTYGVLFLIWKFFTRTLVSAYAYLSLESQALQAVLLILSTLILFGFFSGFLGIILFGKSYGPVTDFLATSSVIFIPGVILFFWPPTTFTLNDRRSEYPPS